MTYQDAIQNSTFIIWQIVTYSIIAPREPLVALDLSEISETAASKHIYNFFVSGEQRFLEIHLNIDL